MILSENDQKIEKFCKDIKYQLELLDSHMVVYKEGKKPLITDKQYAESIRTILDKVEEVEKSMPEDFQREKTLNDKLNEVYEKMDEVKAELNELMASFQQEAEEYDRLVHEAIDEI